MLDAAQERGNSLRAAYRMPDGREVTTTSLAADDWKGVEPIYETMPGWSESTFGVKDGGTELHQAWLKN